MIRTFLLASSAVVSLTLLTWGGIYVGGYFSSQQEMMRTKVIEQSLSYKSGMRNQLNGLYLQYQTAGDDQAAQAAIGAVVRDTFASVDTTDYPANLKSFLVEVGAR